MLLCYLYLFRLILFILRALDYKRISCVVLYVTFFCFCSLLSMIINLYPHVLALFFYVNRALFWQKQNNRADVMAGAQDNFTPLHFCSQAGCAEGCRVLLAAGAKVDAKLNKTMKVWYEHQQHFCCTVVVLVVGRLAIPICSVLVVCFVVVFWFHFFFVCFLPYARWE